LQVQCGARTYVHLARDIRDVCDRVVFLRGCVLGDQCLDRLAASLEIQFELIGHRTEPLPVGTESREALLIRSSACAHGARLPGILEVPRVVCADPTGGAGAAAGAIGWMSI